MIEINGIKYIRKENKPPKKDLSLFGMSMMMLSGMASQYYHTSNNNTGGSLNGRVENCDIIKEFGLIQLKKSNLSKSQREWVVKEFNKNYERI